MSNITTYLISASLRPFLDVMPVLADSGYEGAGHGVHVPVKKPAGVKKLDINNRARNALLTSARCLGERGFALLTPALADPPARHRQPRENRPDRPRSTRPGAIRAQDAHVKVAGKTSLCIKPGPERVTGKGAELAQDTMAVAGQAPVLAGGRGDLGEHDPLGADLPEVARKVWQAKWWPMGRSTCRPPRLISPPRALGPAPQWH